MAAAVAVGVEFAVVADNKTITALSVRLERKFDSLALAEFISSDHTMSGRHDATLTLQPPGYEPVGAHGREVKPLVAIVPLSLRRPGPGRPAEEFMAEELVASIQ